MVSARTAFPNGLSVFGVPVLGSGPVFTTGDVYFVHNTGSNDNNGTDPKFPKKTLDAAIKKCTANNGDYVVILPNHAEAIATATALAASVAGVTIIGIGHGENRPTITFDTATTALFTISAADVTLINVILRADIDSLAKVVDVKAKQFKMVNVELQEVSAKQFLIGVNVGTADNDSDGFEAYGCVITQIAAGGDSGIKFTKVVDRSIVRDCWVDGDWSDAGIHNPTGAICTKMLLDGNVVRNRQTGDHAVEIVSACTGEAVDNKLFGDTLGTIFDPGSLFCAGNMESDAIDQAGVPTPLVPAMGTAPGTNKNVFDAIGFDGAAVIAASAGMLRTMIGTLFVVKKTLTSSAILTTGVDVTGLSSVGDINIEDVMIQADGTGLAAGTNLTLETNNSKGATPFFSNAITALGAQGNISLKSATVRENTVLESGKKIIAICTVASCTGAGTIDIYLLCRRLADNATLAAA